MKYNFHENKFTETDVLPHRVAVAGSDGDIDWQTLKTKVERLSSVIKTIYTETGSPVIIYGHKESGFPVSILSCFHAGVPYIPIDVIYPAERIRLIIESTGVQLLINCSDQPVNFDVPVILTADAELISNKKVSRKSTDEPGEQLQYIMFTSGSTGQPKGVRISRSSVLKFIDWSLSGFGFHPSDVFMNQAPFTFDVSLCDLLNAFGLGATVVLNSSAIVKNQDEFIARLSVYKCSVWTSTPSFAYLFLRNPGFVEQSLPSVKTFLFMGEALPNRTCWTLKNKFPASRILNAYGPTEATIVTTLVEITESILQQYDSLPIGFPMPGSELLIDKKPGDTEGELIIAGDHVSTGYFKNEELNAQKFFVHNGKRAFRTGDMAYYKDGMLFYSGRNDELIKMHGYRIELEEINHHLGDNEFISEAVTVPLKRNDEIKKIVSFVTLRKNIDTEELKQQLVASLEKKVPYYMIPGDIVVVQDFPFTVSHKVDKQRLISDYILNQTGQ